ncbi:MAG TPA: methyltransferase domain-containing protein [Azospirillaceae bacterium]|nr:methyltransferase domain-containing protein [Azospirillaceae bacterium]
MAWDPAQYELFQAARARPGHDLIAALPPLRPRHVADLGCGTGGLTRRLAEQYPDAEVMGLDSSPAMLAKAGATPGRVAWSLGDIAHWHAPGPMDLVFSNAALHWLEDHAALFPRLMRTLAPGGVLAVQMPRNFASPSHALIRRVAAEGPWAERLAPALREAPVHEPAAYHRWLAPHAAHVDVWETEYLHLLDGADPVLEWTRGTALLPVQETLEPAEFAEFLARYRDLLRAAYPPERDGRTLFPFRRLFIVARARG